MDVPSTIVAETARHVGDPKFRFPASENAWPLSFRSLVQRTTSHGGVGVSRSAWSRRNCELRETLRLWLERKGNAGDDERGVLILEEEIRDWNRRSKGRNDGEGLLRPGREATDGRTLLPGEETKDPCDWLDYGSRSNNWYSYLNGWCVVRPREDRIYRTPGSLWQAMQ